MPRAAAIVAGWLAALATVAAVAPAHASPVRTPTAGGTGSATRAPVIVVGVPGLRWDAVTPTATPQLWQLAGRGSLGSLSVKAVPPVSCPDDGWLTAGAGNRATAKDRAGCTRSGVGELRATGDGASVGGFVALAAANRKRDDATRLGALADTLGKAGECVSAAGSGAALAAARTDGEVASYRPDPVGAAADRAFMARCPVTFVAATPADADRVVADAQASLPGAVVLVIGVSDLGGGTAHLHIAIASGAGFAPGPLVSASTRRAPFVQLVDIAPTVLALRGLAAPTSMIGQPWRQAGGARGPLAARVAHLARLDRKAQLQEAAVVPFFSVLVAVMVVVCAAAWLAARRRTASVDPARTGRLRRYAIASAAVALLPAASFLAGTVPWWRTGHPLPVLFGVTAAFAVICTGIAVLIERTVLVSMGFGLAAAVGVLTAGVIGVDLLSGAHLQIFTVAGYSPLVAGRFAGIGNVAFGVFAAGALIAAAGLGGLVGARAPRRPGRWAAAAVAATGAVAVVLDGAPPWGSDVGGVLALVPAVAALAWWVAGARVSWRAGLGVVVAAIGAVAVLGAIDYSRPAAHQTHLGRFVGELLHGGAWTVVRRKALADVHLLTHSPLTLLIPLLVVAGVWVVRRPPVALARSFEREPILRPALGALLVMAIVGALVNDSGIAIPALAVLVVLPAAMSVVVACAAPTTSDEQPEPGERLLR